MTELEVRLQDLIDRYGLELVLEQNDIQKIDVLEILYEAGLLDLEEYFYQDEEDLDDLL